jgi:YlmC/YmxH family sporulation protein
MTQDLRNKEVINIYDGKSLGYVYDIEVNLEKGIIEGIIVPAQRGFLSFFGWGGSDYVIKWKDIRRIGDDVILVDVAGLFETDAGSDRNHITKPRYGGLDKDRYKDTD